jgi:hemolysin III
MNSTDYYSTKEEIANSIVHGIGAALGIAALVILIVSAALKGSAWHVVSFSIYGATLIILYTMSTIYHALTHRRAKDIFEIFDHCAIYLLIAGTYTPFTLVPLHGRLGWWMFGIIWGLAIIGIVFKVYFVKRFIVVSTMIYIGMGWMITIGLKRLWEAMPTAGLIWLALGGVLYTGGTIFYVKKRVTYFHAIWHVFVLAGSICHFFCVLLYVLPIKV